MKLLPIYLNPSKNKNNCNFTFAGRTILLPNKVIEEDILSINSNKENWVNPSNLQSNFVGTNIRRLDNNSLEIISKFNHQTGTISYNPNKLQPRINVEMGNFQPLIKLQDEELGITILMTRGSSLIGSGLNINYKPLAQKSISFGNNKLLISTGYKANQTKAISNNYFEKKKYLNVQQSSYANKLIGQYTLVGLASGYGSRLKPISDLNNNNKIATLFPNTDKSLLEVSVLDVASKIPGIKSVDFIDEPEDNLCGTAGIIIKGLKNGKIPDDKPLVLMTGDTFNNIDIAKAIYDYEQDNTIGIAMLVNKIDKEDWIGNAPVTFDENNVVTKLNPTIQPETNSYELISQMVDGQLYVGTNITILHPQILKFLKQYADENGKADFVEFLGLMYNVLNKKDELLVNKYSNGLPSKNLSIFDLTDSLGYPVNIKNETNNNLLFKVIKAKDVYDNTPKWYDIGTIEDYIKAIRTIKTSHPKGLSDSFIQSVKNSIDDDGVIYYSQNAKTKLDLFKQKYGINFLSGNIIVHSTDSNKPIETNAISSSVLNINADVHKKHSVYSLYEQTSPQNANSFIQKVISDNQLSMQMLIKTFGFANVLKWYCDKNGYYGAYESFLDKFYKESSSIDELLKYQPNWAPWKLEEKAWLLDNNRQQYTLEENQIAFNNFCNSNREYPFCIGNLPYEFFDIPTYRNLINTLKTNDIKDDIFYINNNACYVKRLKGGDLNDKFVYLISVNGKKFILKFDRTNIEDMNVVNGRIFSNYEKQVIRKNKFLSADSVFLNACVSRYLELNGCDIIPHLYFYDHLSHSSITEYVTDINGDKYQLGLMDEEYISLNEINEMFPQLSKYGIYLNDSALKNILVDSDNKSKIIDLGHCSYISPFKPGVKKYNIELSNINGPDIRNIYASFWVNFQKN